jgi:hypothetical protein
MTSFAPPDSHGRCGSSEPIGKVHGIPYEEVVAILVLSGHSYIDVVRVESGIGGADIVMILPGKMRMYVGLS